MPPKKKTKHEIDPSVVEVKSALEQNVHFFIGNVSSYVGKYSKSLQQATELMDAARNAKVAVDPTPDEAVVNVSFPDNTALLDQLKQMKKEAYELSTVFDGISDWIDLNAPEKEQGAEDSTGVEIQNSVVEQIGSLNETIKSVYDLELKYLSERAEAEAQVLKMPVLMSLQLQLEVYDSDTWDEVDRSWRALIRVCLILYTVLAKNMAKLKHPAARRTAAAGYH